MLTDDPFTGPRTRPLRPTPTMPVRLAGRITVTREDVGLPPLPPPDMPLLWTGDQA